MTFFVHAPNIHGGGGKTLLLALIENLQQPAILQLDERLNDLPELSSEVKVIKVAPNIFSRFMAEFRLKKSVSPLSKRELTPSAINNTLTL